MDEIVKQRSIREVLERYIKVIDGGWFRALDFIYHCNLRDYNKKHNAYQCLSVLVKEGLLVKDHTRAGWYRESTDPEEEMKWWEDDPNDNIGLKMPFGIDKYAQIPKGSVILVSGSKNVGKTAFLYNILWENMNNFNCVLFNNETQGSQMHKRLLGFTGEVPKPPPFKTYRMLDDIADAIFHDKINMVDYLDVNKDFWMLGEHVDRIWRKLTTGVAFVGTQKPNPKKIMYKGNEVEQTTDSPYGGSLVLKRVMYQISIDYNRAKLMYVKQPSQYCIDNNIDPSNMQWAFELHNGVRFTNVRRIGGV